MTDGTKKVLIVGGVVVVGYFGWKYFTKKQFSPKAVQRYFDVTNPSSNTLPYNPNIRWRYHTTVDDIRRAERSAEDAYGSYADTAHNDQGYLRS